VSDTKIHADAIFRNHFSAIFPYKIFALRIPRHFHVLQTNDHPVNGIALYRKPITELWSVTCRMGSHSVTCYQTQVNVTRHNPSQTGRYSIYLPRRDSRLSWPWCWLLMMSKTLENWRVSCQF